MFWKGWFFVRLKEIEIRKHHLNQVDFIELWFEVYQITRLIGFKDISFLRDLTSLVVVIQLTPPFTLLRLIVLPKLTGPNFVPQNFDLPCNFFPREARKLRVYCICIIFYRYFCFHFIEENFLCDIFEHGLVSNSMNTVHINCINFWRLICTIIY